MVFLTARLFVAAVSCFSAFGGKSRDVGLAEVLLGSLYGTLSIGFPLASIVIPFLGHQGGTSEQSIRSGWIAVRMVPVYCPEKHC